VGSYQTFQEQEKGILEIKSNELEERVRIRVSETCIGA
jgi:hypothetical protein